MSPGQDVLPAVAIKVPRVKMVGIEAADKPVRLVLPALIAPPEIDANLIAVHPFHRVWDDISRRDDVELSIAVDIGQDDGLRREVRAGKAGARLAEISFAVAKKSGESPAVLRGDD